MNLLFMNNGLLPYGIPRNGLVSIIDPWRDTYGRNILPVNSENFVTGWTGVSGETVTVTDYPTTININGVNTAVIAKRIQGTGNGGALEKYLSPLVTGLANPHTSVCGMWAMSLGPTCKIGDYYGLSNNYTTLPSSMTKLSSTQLTSSTNSRICLWTGSIGNKLDILVYQPQVSLGTLYPYAPPSGLPQSLTDYSGHGNTFQLGSAAGADTNDPAWSGNGLVMGTSGDTDNYLKSSSPAFDDMQAFTCITVCKPLSAGGGDYGKIAWKAGAGFNGWGIYLIGDAAFPKNIAFMRYADSSNYKHWRTPIIDYNVSQVLGVSSSRNINDNATNMYVNDQKRTANFLVSGTPSIVSDASNDLLIGNSDAATRNFGGTFYCQLWYNRILSDAEYMQAYNGLRRLMNQRGVVI